MSVQDSGAGIPESDLPRLFTPFFRSSSEATRGVGGLGLGLYLSRLLVQAHGGEVAVESVEGRGTTVKVSLPLREAPAATA